jgi:hypothetical protein
MKAETAASIKKSVWFPLGFSVSYLVVAIVTAPHVVNPFKRIAVVGLAFISALLVWAFYCFALHLKLPNLARTLVLTGLLAPAVIAGTFLLIAGPLW